jgi:hypothetical protein
MTANLFAMLILIAAALFITPFAAWSALWGSRTDADISS